MAGPDQEQQPQANEVEKLFQNVGQGLTLINQYVSQAAPESQELAAQMLQGFEQLVQQVAQARQGGGGERQAEQPIPVEAGAGQTRPV
jgi:hypothetical protein